MLVENGTDGLGQIWKIPASIPLSHSEIINKSGVENLYYRNIDSLNNLGFSHFGDPDYHEFESKGYLVVPLTGAGNPGIAFFSINPLRYVTYAFLDKTEQGGDNAGWCAVNKKGKHYHFSRQYFGFFMNML